MSDMWRDQDDEADAWGAVEPDVPPIPVDDAPAPVAWTPEVAPAPPVGDADPVWARPVRGPDAARPEPDPVWPSPAPEPVADREPDAVWSVPVREPEPEPAWSAPVAAEPDPVWSVPAPEPVADREPDHVWSVPAREPEPEPAWSAPVVAEPEQEPSWHQDAGAPSSATDPWGPPTAPPARPASDPWGIPAQPADPWGLTQVAGAGTGAAVPDPDAGRAAPGPLSDRLAHAAPSTRPPEPTPEMGQSSASSVDPFASRGANQDRSPTGSTPASAAAGWPTAPGTSQDGATEWQRTTPVQGTPGQPSWPAAATTSPGYPVAGAGADRTPGTATPTGYAAGYAASQPPVARPTSTPVGGVANTWPGASDPRAAAWPAEPRSPYAPPTSYGQSGHPQQPATRWPQGSQAQAQAGYGPTPSGYGQTPAGYGQTPAGYGQGGYGGSAQSAQPGWPQQPQAAGQWSNQAQWADQSPAAQQAAWAGYAAQQGQQAQGWATQQPAASGWDQSGQAAWGATNAAYWAAEGPGVEAGYGRSMGAVLAGIMLFVFGTLVALAGVGIFVLGPNVDVDEWIRQAGLTTLDGNAVRDGLDVAIGLSPFVAVIGVFELLAGLLVLAHKTFGRVLGILYGLAGTLFGGLVTVALFQVGRQVTDTGTQVDLTGNLGFFVPFTLIYLFIFLALAAAGKHFRRGEA